MYLRLLTSRFAAVVLILLMLAGCASLPPGEPETPADPDVARAHQLYQEQDYANAAAAYLTLAKHRIDAERQTFLLQGADAALLGGDVELARTTLQQLGPTPLTRDEQLLRQLLQAEIAIRDKQLDQALSLLVEQEPDPDHRLDLRKRYYRTLADAHRQNGSALLSAQAIQQLLDLVDDEPAQLAYQIELLRTLGLMSTQALEQQRSDLIGGWMQLALLNRRHRHDPEALRVALDEWRTQFRDHPALLGELIEHQQSDASMQPLTHIGVLLPQTGRYAAVSQAIRDGILFSLDQMPAAQRPVLNFYDSSNIEAIWPLYNQAIEQGADFIIGPLQKEAVSQLIRAGELHVPVLALNTVIINRMMPANLSMYSLDPEDEARQVAERIWQDGKRRPVVLIPDNVWGERLLNAFQAAWLSLSGNTPGAQRYNPDSYDHTKSITSLLHINRSQARHAELQRWLGRSLEFVPRRRADVDAVFVATQPQQATAFSPQLKYHMAGDLPIYTTSHIWSGRINRHQLTDMRGIILPDIPLIADNAERARLAGRIPGIQSNLVRLYAMGMDAFNLAPHLQRLQANPYESLEGQTGSLYMDEESRVRRRLVWLQLDSPIKNLGYANRLDRPHMQASGQTGEPAAIR